MRAKEWKRRRWRRWKEEEDEGMEGEGRSVTTGSLNEAPVHGAWRD